MMIFKRPFWGWLHRWAGLVMAGFLIVVGLTGSLLAFYPELERLINSQFYPQQTAGQKLDFATLATQAKILAPDGRVNGVVLESNQETTLVAISPRIDGNSEDKDLGFNQLILNPYTGEELGRRQFGAISDGMINFMPFVYQLHYALALDSIGMWVLGICALIWSIDCFIGFYLTLPQRRRSPLPPAALTNKHNSNTWWRRWQPAWKIRWAASRYKLNFDLHRANGLWLWPVLFIFAWSSVYMNLWDTVYTWTTRTVFEYKTSWTELPKQMSQPSTPQEPKLGWRQAQAAGQYWMAKQAKQHDFEIHRPVALWLDSERNVYQYLVRSSRDIQDRRGATRVFFDADTGAFKLLLLPSGQYSGNTVTSWLYALHMGNVFGLPYRLFVCLMGLIIVLLSVTGIIVWIKKRRAQISKHVTVAQLRQQKFAALRGTLQNNHQ